MGRAQGVGSGWTSVTLEREGGAWGFSTGLLSLEKVPSGNGTELGPDSKGKKEERGEMGPSQSGSRQRGRSTLPEPMAGVGGCSVGSPTSQRFPP